MLIDPILIYKISVFGTGMAAVVCLILYIKVLTRNKEIIKARLFLRYKQYVNIWKYGSILLVAVILGSIAYTLIAGPEKISEGVQAPYSLFVLAVNMVVTYVGLIIYSVLRGASGK